MGKGLMGEPVKKGLGLLRWHQNLGREEGMVFPPTRDNTRLYI